MIATANTGITDCLAAIIQIRPARRAGFLERHNHRHDHPSVGMLSIDHWDLAPSPRVAVALSPVPACTGSINGLSIETPSWSPIPRMYGLDDSHRICIKPFSPSPRMYGLDIKRRAIGEASDAQPPHVRARLFQVQPHWRNQRPAPACTGSILDEPLNVCFASANHGALARVAWLSEP